MGSFQVRTEARTAILNVTPQVVGQVAEAGVDEGLCLVSTDHTTVGLTVNEPESDLVRDILAALERLVPAVARHAHPENSDSHIKASLIGGSVALPVAGGKAQLGAWQAVLLCEFDGPRTKTVRVTVVGREAQGA